MKIKSKTQPSRTTKLVITLAVAATLITIGLLGFIYMKKIGPFTKDTSGINYSPPTKDEQQTGDQIKEQNSKNSDTTNTGSDPSPAPTPSTGSSKPTVGVEITAANQNKGVLSIRILVQTLSSGGTCSLSMSGPAGKIYSAVAESQTGPSTSTCKGFDVPVSSLSSGTWTITIQYEDASVKGSASKEITVI